MAMLAHPQNPSPFAMMNAVGGLDAPRRRKRKAESQENERLSKRMSFLSIERGGTRHYVPVENPHHISQQNPSFPSTNPNEPHASVYSAPMSDGVARSPSYQQYPPPTAADEMMHVDDSKHKVYIYNLDDELSSSDSDSDPSENGRLLFIPDIERHLLANRIPPRVLQNDNGDLADMQLVLYREPTSLTVPEEHDSVRRAVMEARERLREKQRLQREGRWTEQQQQEEWFANDRAYGGPGSESSMVDDDPDAMDWS